MDNAIYKEINFNGELKNAKVSNGGALLFSSLLRVKMLI